MKKFIYIALSFAPVLALAQGLGQATNVVDNITSLINKVIPLLFAIALIYFFWGLIQFLRASGTDPKAKDIGKTHMIYGILALAVMVSIYGIINWLTTTAGLTNTAPTLPGGPTRVQ